MDVKRMLIVSLALGAAPVMGCKKKSNTTEQTQAPAGTGDTRPGMTDPNQPNPVGAQSGSTTMGTEATGVGTADNAMSGSGTAGMGTTTDAGTPSDGGAMTGSGAGSAGAGSGAKHKK